MNCSIEMRWMIRWWQWQCLDTRLYDCNHRSHLHQPPVHTWSNYLTVVRGPALTPAQCNVLIHHPALLLVIIYSQCGRATYLYQECKFPANSEQLHSQPDRGKRGEETLRLKWWFWVQCEHITLPPTRNGSPSPIFWLCCTNEELLQAPCPFYWLMLSQAVMILLYLQLITT